MITHRHPRSVALDRSPQNARALRAPAGRASSLDGRSGHPPERFPWEIVLGPAIVFVALYVLAVQAGVVDWWVTRMVVLAEMMP